MRDRKVGTSKGRRSRRWLWAGIATWLACFLLVDAATVGVSGWVNSFQLATSHDHARATVTAFVAGNHGGCRYSYLVTGRKLAGSWSPCPSGAHVGSHFLVTYVGPHPSISQPGDPTGAVVGGSLILVLVPLLFGALIARQVRRREPRSQMDDAPRDDEG